MKNSPRLLLEANAENFSVQLSFMDVPVQQALQPVRVVLEKRCVGAGLRLRQVAGADGYFQCVVNSVCHDRLQLRGADMLAALARVQSPSEFVTLSGELAREDVTQLLETSGRVRAIASRAVGLTS